MIDNTDNAAAKAAQALGVSNGATNPKGYATQADIDGTLGQPGNVVAMIGHGASNVDPSGGTTTGPMVGPMVNGANQLGTLPSTIQANVAILGFCHSAEAVSSSGSRFSGIGVVTSGRVDLAQVGLSVAAAMRGGGTAEQIANRFVASYNRVAPTLAPGVNGTFFIVPGSGGQ
ncbi:hypothetical protein [Mesoterricola sediminis]|uniref:hypothetical protein n=1 Tax=Mesoterricola sediminis TaxID=2927980 RepID=UPI002931CC48|nr:hypothetical protein [Mesoterricola sediminis]